MIELTKSVLRRPLSSCFGVEWLFQDFLRQVTGSRKSMSPLMLGWMIHYIFLHGDEKLYIPTIVLTN